MGKALIIAEKPSVALDISKALGGFAKQQDYYESDRYVLSSAVGHLLEITPPEGVEAARGKWTFTHLPVIPPHFDLQPRDEGDRSGSRLKLLRQLAKRKDVDALINACDAGREGELIFRYIVQYLGAKQPIQRLWLQSMTPAAIREGFAALRSDESMQPLAAAAVCRSESDWLIGINGTRAMTAFNSKTGGFHKTTVGRVQTPTLAIVVERERRIREFVPRDYWEVIATFDAQAGSYTGRWFDERFKKPEGKDGDAELKAERVWEKPKAEAIRAKCLGKPGIVTEESKPSTQLSPLLFDLTSLQREANSRFGFSAKNTLSIAQALYERHKVLTYPRTDSRHLPEDYPPTVRKTLEVLKGVAAYGSFADKILAEQWVKPGNKRIFNNAKVSDHFAIIPTTQAPKHLSEAEQKIYDMVAKRFLAVFYPAAEFLETTRITRVEGEPFKSVGKVLLKPGWLEVYGREAQGEDDAANLTPVQPDERVHTREIEVKQLVTKPPPRFTEATLLSAMEGAGKLVEDDELREAMAEKGLGTPATRAAIIEGLIFEDYMHRHGRELVPTAKAFSLMVLLNGLGVEALTKPELTGEWEHKLKQMERGRLRREAFMAEIRELTKEIVGKAKSYEHDTIPGDFGVLNTRCPKCGGEVHENYKKFQCQKCDWALWKIVSGRQFEPEEIEELIAKKQVGPLHGFRSRLGKPFSAVIKLSPEGEPKFDFGDDQKGGNGPDGNDAAPPVDFTGKEPLGKCPKCGARVFENGMTYVCEKSVAPVRTCDFRTGTVILQQPVERAQMTKLLATGKTDLLEKFVSKRNGRSFKAFLALKDGKVGFEFAPREPRAKTGAAKSNVPQPKIDFTGKEPLGKCPRCGARVFETDTQYVCEKAQADSKPCKFRSGKIVLHQPVERAQMTKLLATGRTDLLPKFISKAGRPFPAYLVVGEDGKVGFEFAERAAPGHPDKGT
ncbi:MAG: DNA topoisomerase III [Verrucomicrobia bacterium]|nr:DNA topoisomerase III [Verrucomicrobiota bacterium]